MNVAEDRIDPPGRLRTLLAGLIVLLIFLVPAGGFWWLRVMSRSAHERNALSHARDMLIVHFARTQGSWPRSWDDLAVDFEPADSRYGTPGMETLKQLVGIDFSFNTDVVFRAEANSGDFPQVLWLKGHTDSEMVRAANEHLIDALRAWSQRRRAGEHPPKGG